MLTQSNSIKGLLLCQQKRSCLGRCGVEWRRFIFGALLDSSLLCVRISTLLAERVLHQPYHGGSLPFVLAPCWGRAMLRCSHICENFFLSSSNFLYVFVQLHTKTKALVNQCWRFFLYTDFVHLEPKVSSLFWVLCCDSVFQRIVVTSNLTIFLWLFHSHSVCTVLWTVTNFLPRTQGNHFVMKWLGKRSCVEVFTFWKLVGLPTDLNVFHTVRWSE
jgi:hypothetical protein